MTSTPDARLVEAHDLARSALLEITPAATIGDPAGYSVEDDGVVSLRFANRMAGYPGWLWTVSVAAAAPDAEPTVLEVELLPADGALTAPDWVPWAVRLADYQAAQAALAETAAEGDELEVLVADDDLDLDGDDDDDDEDDEDDLDADAGDGSPVLHAGDLDGVDIDELDDDANPDADDLDDPDDADVADADLDPDGAAPDDADHDEPRSEA